MPAALKLVSAELPPLFGPQVLLMICFGSIWTVFQEASLNLRTDTFRFKRMHVLREMKATMTPQHVVQKERFLLESQVFFNISAFLALSVSYLPFRMTATHLWEERPSPASEHTSAIPLPRSRFPVPGTFLLRGASSSRLIGPPHAASQEDGAS